MAPAQRTGPLRRHELCGGLHPVVGTGHLAAIGPGLAALRATVRGGYVAGGILTHDGRRAAYGSLVDDVVVHLQRTRAPLHHHRVGLARVGAQTPVVPPPPAALAAPVALERGVVGKECPVIVDS